MCTILIVYLVLSLVLAFGVGDAKDGFNFAFPSFKLGAKGDVEDESEEGDQAKAGFSFGIGCKAPKEGGKFKVLFNTLFLLKMLCTDCNFFLTARLTICLT